MRVRAITEYRTRSGKLRRIRLYKAWMNMRDRCAGHIMDGSGAPTWKGLTIAWKSFAEFRAWALAHGYSRLNNSLDRERATEGYGPDNCRWIPIEENSRRSMYNTRAKMACQSAS